MARTDVLDPREQRFVELYVETNNATRSALVAGYGSTVKSAGVLASKLLARVRVASAVERRNAEIMAELDFTPDRIIKEIAKVAGVNMADFVTIDEHGEPHLDLSDVKRRQLAAVASVEGSTAKSGAKIKMHDKLKALDMLARMARLFPAERTELTGANGGPVLTANLHKVDIASLEPEQREQLRSVLLALKHQAGDSEGSNE